MQLKSANILASIDGAKTTLKFVQPWPLFSFDYVTFCTNYYGFGRQRESNLGRPVEEQPNVPTMTPLSCNFYHSFYWTSIPT